MREMRHLSAPSTSQPIAGQSFGSLRRRANAVLPSDRAFESETPCVAHVAHCELECLDWLAAVWLAGLSIGIVESALVGGGDGA